MYVCMLVQLDKYVIIKKKQNLWVFLMETNNYLMRTFHTNTFFILNCNFNYTMTVLMHLIPVTPK